MVNRVNDMWTVVKGWRLFVRHASPVRQEAQAPVFVLIHGLLISSRYMVPTAERLGMMYPVYALDLPGFGKSADPAKVLTIEQLSDAIVAWLDVMHLPQAIFLGNSLGGQILIDLAARYPERVDRLILVGPTVDPQARTVIQQATRLLVDFVFEKPSLLYHLLIDSWRAGVWRTWQTFQYALADYSEEKLGAIGAPTLVVRGERDRVAPQRWIETIVQRLPNGQAAVIEGGPHCVNYTTPDALVQVVQTFLADNRQPFTNDISSSKVNANDKAQQPMAG